MDVKQAIGQRVMEARQALGLTQGQLAERCGLVDETISRIERGVQGVTIENLCKIATTLGVSLAMLVDIGGRTDEPARSARVQELARLLATVDERTADVAFKLVKLLVEESQRGTQRSGD